MNNIFRNFKWSFASKILISLFQVIILIIFARHFGAEILGMYISSVSLILFFNSFINPGANNLLILLISGKNYNKNKTLATYLKYQIIFSLVFTVIITISGYILYNFSNIWFYIFILTILQEVFIKKYFDLYISTLQAKNNIKLMSIYQTYYSLIRVFFAMLFLIFDNENFILYLILTSLFKYFLLLYISKKFNTNKYSLKKNSKIIFLSNIRKGFLFSIDQSSKTINTNTDKVMLSHYISPDITGIYTVAYRMINFAFIPIQALLSVTYSKFFELGQYNEIDAFKFMLKTILIPIIYSIFIGLFLFYFSSYVYIIFGPEYKDSSEILKYFSILPFILVLNFFISDFLMGSGYIKAKTYLQLFSASINIILNIFLIQKYQMIGAAIATIISESILTFTITLITIYILFKGKK